MYNVVIVVRLDPPKTVKNLSLTIFFLCVEKVSEIRDERKPRIQKGGEVI